MSDGVLKDISQKNEASMVPKVNGTVPPQVKWELKHRQFQDKIWGLAFCVGYMAYLSCGMSILNQAQPRWEWSNAMMVRTAEGDWTDQTIRIVSSYFRDEAIDCCAPFRAGQGRIDLGALHDLGILESFDVCLHLDREDAIREDPLGEDARRYLQEMEESSSSRFEMGDGMFDAFLDAPEIVVTLCLLALVFCINSIGRRTPWLVSFRKDASNKLSSNLIFLMSSCFGC